MLYNILIYNNDVSELLNVFLEVVKFRLPYANENLYEVLKH